MAHWAQLDENNVVIWVTVGNNDHADEGYQWLVDNIGGTWVKTSYNTHGGKHLLGGTPLRMNFASIGHTYDEERDAFIPPKPEGNWVFNEETCLWDIAPMPDDGKHYRFDMVTSTWVEVEDAQ